MSSPVDIAAQPARVLIVDDERDNRRLLEVMLGHEGFVLSTAASGADALTQIAHLPPDLILLDVMMPEMDGLEVTGHLKGNAATKNIPIIMVTAQDDHGVRLRGLDAGAEDFLTKPVDRAELCARVRNLLRLKIHGDYHDKYSRLLEREVGSRTADLVESERLYRETFDAAPVGIVHAGLDGQWQRVNQRLCDLLGYAREDLQNSAVEDNLLQTEEAEGEAEAFRLMAAGMLDRYVIDEKRYRRRGGSFMWGRVKVSVHRDTEGQARHFILVVEDITERRELEAQLRQSQKLEVVGQLAGGIAHDFNNILTAILGFGEILIQDLGPDNPATVDVLEIKKASERAAGLTRQLLAFSRKQILRPNVLDVNEIIGGMEAMLRKLILENVDLVVSLQPHLAAIKMDLSQLEQIIVNLTVNAGHAMPRGGKLTIETANVKLDESYQQRHLPVTPGDYVMLAVSDTGVGMDQTVMRHIFEPFFTTKEVGRGTGLGLATVYGVVKQSGGDIWVYSEPGHGTTFKIYLPQVSEDVSAAVRPTTAPGESPTGSETILLVEDDRGVRRLAQLILERAGYHVIEAESPPAALGLAAAFDGPIHLLLSDVIMPDSEGPPLYLRLAALRPQLRVLYMSGYADEAIVRHGVIVDGTPFLQKPFTPLALNQKVREVLDGPPPAAPLGLPLGTADA
jgi:two-component system cell cycle sensor histidine kinase/response regulator CckA